MSRTDALDIQTLERLRGISIEMLALAEQGKWEAMKEVDSKRLAIAVNAKQCCSDVNLQPTRQRLIEQIMDLDAKVLELATVERKRVMDEELRQQSQVAALAGYQQVL